MDESSSEKGIINRIKGFFMKPETKPYTQAVPLPEKGLGIEPVTTQAVPNPEQPLGTHPQSQARPMTAEEYLENANKIPTAQKTRWNYRAEAKARKEVSQRRTRRMNTAAALVGGVAALGAVAVGTGAPQRVGEGFQGARQGIENAVGRVPKEPVEIQAEEIRKRVEARDARDRSNTSEEQKTPPAKPNIWEQKAEVEGPVSFDENLDKVMQDYAVRKAKTK